MSDISLIGCRISIISKAKIRYEGYLHSVDCDTPNEPVITLSKVWSFGTEDRPCERPVAPRNEEYKQVVFRGRDLEDVRLVQSSVFLNQDSAIVSAAPGSAVPQASSVEKNRTDIRPNDHASISDAANCGIPPMPSSESVSLDMLSQNTIRCSPLVSQSLPMNSRPWPIGTVQSDRPQQADSRGPRPFGDGRSDADTGLLLGATKVSSGRPAQSDSFYDSSKQRSNVNNRLDSAQQWSNKNAFHREVSSDFHSRINGASSDRPHRQRSGYNHWLGNQRGFRHPPTGSNRRTGRGNYYGWPRSRTDLSSTISQATFTGEYDYEKANAELAAELEKISITVSKSNSSVDGDTGKGDDSGGSLAGEDACYDKAKSFFDTLSSELMEKANGITSQRMNRRDERLLNSATFGMVPTHYPRRGARGGSGGYYRRSSGGHGGYTYGQRRAANGGGFSKHHGSNPSAQGSYTPSTALSTANDTH